MSIVSRKLFGSSVLILLSVGLAAAFLVLWPKPVSVVLAGISLLCGFAALLVFCRAAGRGYALLVRRAIFLASGSFGLALVGLAWKYRQSAPTFSSASLFTAAMLSLGAVATFLITRSFDPRKINLKS